MKNYRYTYYNQPISKQIFTSNVPENWEDDLENETYSYGGYRAIRIDNN